MRAKFDRKSIKKGLRRLAFLVGNFTSYFLPDCLYRSFMFMRFAAIPRKRRDEALARVYTYVRLAPSSKIVDMTDSPMIGENTGSRDVIRTKSVRNFRFPFKQKHRFSAYFFDLYQSIRLCTGNPPFHYLFGNIDYECPEPTFVKSRPIPAPGAFTNSVICRLDRLRHFNFVHDTMPWSQKKPMLVFRNVVNRQPWRTRFIEAAIKCSLCDAGQVNPNPEHPEHVRPFMSMDEQLTYKFVATIEGHDVATNLKWVMSSNSIAVMPKPRVESWFMESQLIGGYHYIEVKPDYSDLQEKLEYYLAHDDEALKIIQHAQEFVKQFQSPTVEKFVQYNVVKRYFEITANEN